MSGNIINDKSSSKNNSKTNLNAQESLVSSLIIANKNSTSNKQLSNNNKAIAGKIISETPKNLKDEYKRIVKDKNYSRSIDGGIPKQKYAQYQLMNNNNIFTAQESGNNNYTNNNLYKNNNNNPNAAKYSLLSNNIINNNLSNRLKK